jgi:hypothetical protein
LSDSDVIQISFHAYSSKLKMSNAAGGTPMTSPGGNNMGVPADDAPQGLPGPNDEPGVDFIKFGGKVLGLFLPSPE